MKKHITIFIFIIISFIGINLSFAQNELDADGKRHGVWKKYYGNNRIRYVGNFNHGKEVGIFKFYSAANSEFPTVVKEYKKGSDLAEVKFYTVNGIIESKGLMKGKDREGKWIYFHEDGKTVMSEETYKDGKLNGPYKTFYNTSKPTEEGIYKDGLLDGSYKKYSIKGHIYQDFTYVQGKLNGSAKYFSRLTGELITKGTFKNDVRVGTWENWADGELVSTEQPNKKKEKREKIKE